MTSVWGLNLGIVKQKRGQAGLQNRMSPLKWRRRGKDLVLKLNLFPPKRRRKVLKIFYKINIKKVLI
jgi:hypothetical protein